MSSRLPHTVRSPLATLTGLLLIVGPFLGIGFKMVSFGWMMVMIFFGPIFLIAAGYIVQIIIAVQGFLLKRDLFGAARARATTAAWVSLLAFTTAGIFFPDGGDTGYGSTFQVWMGAYGPDADAVHAATDGWSDAIGLGSVFLWVVAFLWLMFEWIVALIRRRKASQAAE